MAALATQQQEEAVVVLRQPPAVLAEPLIYVSEKNASVLERRLRISIADGSPGLPGWISQFAVSRALGFAPGAMERAREEICAGKYYLWATEFENVHSLWRFSEPAIRVGGKVYGCSEEFFHGQKPAPFDAALWDRQRVSVMRVAVLEKFLAQERILKPLLLSTGRHALCSIKNDSFWGFSPRSGGENMLARLWEELRAKLHLQDSLRVIEDMIEALHKTEEDAARAQVLEELTQLVSFEQPSTDGGEVELGDWRRGLSGRTTRPSHSPLVESYSATGSRDLDELLIAEDFRAFVLDQHQCNVSDWSATVDRENARRKAVGLS